MQCDPRQRQLEISLPSFLSRRVFFSDRQTVFRPFLSSSLSRDASLGFLTPGPVWRFFSCIWSLVCVWIPYLVAFSWASSLGIGYIPRRPFQLYLTRRLYCVQTVN